MRKTMTVRSALADGLRNAKATISGSLGLRQRNLALVLALKLLQIGPVLVLLLFEAGNVFRTLFQLLIDVLNTLGHILLAFFQLLLDQNRSIQFVHLEWKL